MPKWLAYVLTFAGLIVLTLFVREIIGDRRVAQAGEGEQASTSAKLPFLELKVSEALSGALLGLAMMVGPWILGVEEDAGATDAGTEEAVDDEDGGEEDDVDEDGREEADPTGDEGENAGGGDVPDVTFTPPLEYPIDCTITAFATLGSVDLAGDCIHLLSQGRQLQDGAALLAAETGGGPDVLTRCTAGEHAELWLRYVEDDGEPAARTEGWVRVGPGETVDLDPELGFVGVHPRDFNKDLADVVEVHRGHVNDDIRRLTVSILSAEATDVATCYRDAASDGESNRVELRWSAP